MKKFTKKQHDLWVALSERGASWDNLEDRPYDICAFEGKIWIHDKKSDRTALIWAVGSMYAEPDYDVPLGKSPFNKRFLDKSIKQTKELKSLAVKILKRHRLHDSQTPTCENVCFKIQGEKINFWESNCIDGIKVEKYSFIDFKDGDNPMVLTLKSLKKAGKELEKTLILRKYRDESKKSWESAFYFLGCVV